MKWLLRLLPSYRLLDLALLDARAAIASLELQVRTRDLALRERSEERDLARQSRDEQARAVHSLTAQLSAAREAREVVHSDLLAATDASARFRQMWEEISERAANAERIAAFYRCAFGNVAVPSTTPSATGRRHDRV